MLEGAKAQISSLEAPRGVVAFLRGCANTGVQDGGGGALSFEVAQSKCWHKPNGGIEMFGFGLD